MTNPKGSWFIWLCVGAILLAFCYGMFAQMPLVTPDCVPSKPDQEGFQATYEDCAAFRRMLTSVGTFIDDLHDDIIALATVIVAVFTFTLWRATDRLWKSADNQLTEFRESMRIAGTHADHMANSVTEAGRAADAMKALSDTSKDTAERQLRAYIGVESSRKGGTILAGAPPSVILKIVNNGATPAKNMFSWSRATIFPVDISTVLNWCREERAAGGATIHPKGEVEIVVKRDETVSTEEDANLRVGKAIFHGWGEIIYDDVFGKERITGFHVTFGGPESYSMQRIGFATDGNDIT